MPRIIPQALQKKVAVRWLPEWDRNYFIGPTSLDWYQGLFRQAAAEGYFTGEITPEYCLLNQEIVKEISNVLPMLRVFIILRDPIDRAWSQFQLIMRHKIRRRKYAREQYSAWFETFLHEKRNLIHARSDYALSLIRWRECFSEEQVFLGFFDDFLSDREAFLARILAHIGVDANLRSTNPTLRVNSHHYHSDSNIGAREEAILAQIALPHLHELAKIERSPHVLKWITRAEKALL